MKKLVKVKLGKNVTIHDFVNLYGCEIGDNTKIGAFVEIQKGVKIGKDCKISSHSFICEGITIKDRVFIGHNVTFINDRYPKSKGRWTLEKTLVKKNASIGSGSTVMCGLTIGEGSTVGAGSVVTKNVPDKTLVVGNPARAISKNTNSKF
ncbi:acetyltransferase [Candidatus Roizmanbacteria bacterium RIFCSPHIGHO2_01_FULL_39_12c]|uniref:Acetyltransferase n=1 Tax=Candidatus Roizmanbacteria bacterium RIFCSPHIGHO2_01_FULL_39_12c TaxID=1802031 RepID=A0A1F7GDY2_9BACT|nr:MAG: acetyltransferase [Candidatus Roizmanbacteria bacterium RIFCSPHIGHO2_01_FULL_39_12c]OGK48142.1 MAG: acetyltransferase [Candidatus Roizmanbacteria bacterium RIFCSPLOWO2_01_FULL_40_13]